MITNIRIANYKSFHPTSPINITLNAQQKPVLIYGLNGAGKSSIGEVIHRSLAGDSAAAACSIQFTGQGPYRTLVYNHEFVERVIGNVVGMPGIFTLGEPDTEKQVEIEAKDAEYASLIKQAEELKTVIATTDDSIKRLSEVALSEVWKAHAAHARGDLGHLLAGYGNSKQKFFDDLRNITVSEGDVLPTKEELKQRWSDVSSDESKKSLVSLDMSQFRGLEVDSIWKDATSPHSQ